MKIFLIFILSLNLTNFVFAIEPIDDNNQKITLTIEELKKIIQSQVELMLAQKAAQEQLMPILERNKKETKELKE